MRDRLGLYFLLSFSICLFFFSFLANVSLVAQVLLSFVVAFVWFVLVFLLSYLGIKTIKQRWCRTFILPAWIAVLQVCFEYMKDRCFSGISWADVYSFFGSIPQLGFIAKFTGYYGLTFTFVYLVVFFVLNRRRKWVYGFCSIFVMMWVGLGMLGIEEEKSRISSAKHDLRVCIFQTKVSHVDKIDPASWDNIWRMYLSYLGGIKGNVDLLVIPETMAMYHWPSSSLIYLLNEVRRMGYRWIICGANCHEGGKVYNGALLFGEEVAIYYKRKLVPFGEFIPDFLTVSLSRFLGKWFGVLNFSGYSNGRSAVLFDVNGVKVLPLICYEDSFGYLVENAISEVGRPDVVVVLSNDDWFGMGWAQWFHLSLGRLVAMRFGVWVVKANNDNLSCIISPWGEILFPRHVWNKLSDGRRIICGIIKI